MKWRWRFWKRPDPMEFKSGESPSKSDRELREAEARLEALRALVEVISAEHNKPTGG